MHIYRFEFLVGLMKQNMALYMRTVWSYATVTVCNPDLKCDLYDW